MTSWKKALWLGFLIWVVPFVIAFIAFPLKTSWRSLFESIMPVTLSLVVVGCAVSYQSRISRLTVSEAARLGFLWWAMCVVIDLPLMLSPPMNYTLSEYAADIGLTYLMIPVITIGIALAATRVDGAMKF